MIYICIPALNEARTIGVLLWKIRQVMEEFPRDYHVLVLDDGSTDDTREVLEPYVRVLPVTLLRNEKTQGYAPALEKLIREAVRLSSHPKRDAVIVMQADFTESPDDIPQLLKRLEGGADIVGTAVTETEGELPRGLRWGRRGLPWLVKRSPRPKEIRDPLSGFRAYRVSVLKRALQDRDGKPLLTRHGWAANAELLLCVTPHVRRAEDAEVSLRYTRRERPTRFSPWATAMELFGFARQAPRRLAEARAAAARADAQRPAKPERAPEPAPDAASEPTRGPRPQRGPEAEATAVAAPPAERSRRSRNRNRNRDRQKGDGHPQREQHDAGDAQPSDADAQPRDAGRHRGQRGDKPRGGDHPRAEQGQQPRRERQGDRSRREPQERGGGQAQLDAPALEQQTEQHGDVPRLSAPDTPPQLPRSEAHAEFAAVDRAEAAGEALPGPRADTAGEALPEHRGDAQPRQPRPPRQRQPQGDAQAAGDFDAIASGGAADEAAGAEGDADPSAPPRKSRSRRSRSRKPRSQGEQPADGTDAAAGEGSAEGEASAQEPGAADAPAKRKRPRRPRRKPQAGGDAGESPDVGGDGSTGTVAENRGGAPEGGTGGGGGESGGE